jgi:uncharacterized tellurite resistance protein B-like protein
MVMTNAPNRTVQMLVKILIGAAWLDGKLQPEEQQYLRRVAQEKGVANDPEIYPLLNGLKPVSQNDSYKWLQEYLGDRPEATACQDLIETISGLIYSDGDMAIEEANFLTKIQDIEQGKCNESTTIRVVNQLYKRWVAIVGNPVH